MDVTKALQILNFSSSTKLSDVSFQTLQDKFAARMEQVSIINGHLLWSNQQDVSQAELQAKSEKKNIKPKEDEKEPKSKVRGRKHSLNNEKIDIR